MLQMYALSVYQQSPTDKIIFHMVGVYMVLDSGLSSYNNRAQDQGEETTSCKARLLVRQLLTVE